MSESAELYELFLGLSPTRLAAARAALGESKSERALALEAALIPFAVDAALLGAEGVSALARAAALSHAAPDAEILAAIDELEEAVDALSHGDESGARVNESELLARADALRQLSGEAQTAIEEEPVVAEVEAESADESQWVPTLAEDMIAAFLDECVERLDGLSERLLALEERGDDRELVGEIFRDLHTLKGSSAFAGLKKMNRVAHLAEDRIGELRDGKRSADRALIDVLLETLDTLRKIVDRARAGAPIDVPVDDLLARLKDPGRAPRPLQAPTPASSAAAPTAPSAARPAASATLRIDFEKVDQLLNLVGEVVLARGRLGTAAEVQGQVLRELSGLRKKLAQAAESGTASRALADELLRIERVLHETYGDLDAGLGSLGLAVGQLRDNVMKLRMVPIARLFTKYQRTVRELANKLEKQVRVELEGADTELDKVLVERLEDPLLHLVRNAVDHGVEQPAVRERAGKSPVGTVRLSASQRGGQILVSIQDDGGGMNAAKLRAKAVDKGLLSAEEAESLSDRESFELIFRAGFSTAEQISDVSGRGVGMDVVRDAIVKLKGAIFIDSEPGKGSRMELRLPLTLAITQVLAARVGGELVAIPLDAVVSAQAIQPDALEAVADGTCLKVGGQLIPLVELATVLGLPQDAALGAGGEASVVIVEVGTDRLGLGVQQVLGRHEVVIKSLGPLLSAAPCAAGATLIGDRVLLVVDLAAVAERSRRPGLAPIRLESQPQASRRARVLVAEDSDVIREAIRRELARAGFDVTVAVDGRQALEIAAEQRFDAVSTDVMMPHMDGYDLTRALRKDPRYADVPIVMVTSKDARIDTMRGYDAGANAYITKPADAGELIRTLDALLGDKRRG